MPNGKTASINESTLKKGELRKLNALRKSIGDELGTKAFTQWFNAKGEKPEKAQQDINVERIAEALQPLIENGQLNIQRGGYLLRRGRGRVIVESSGEK